MIRTIIVENDNVSLKILKNCISDNFKDFEIVGTADGTSQTEKLIFELDPDLVLFDIRINDGTAFDVLEKLGMFNFEIIFLTAYENYAVRAIKWNAVDYIVKPYKIDELIVAMHKAKVRILKKRDQQTDTNKIVLSNLEETIIVDPNDIIRCQADSNYCNVYFSNGEKMILSKTLKTLEDILGNKNFIKTHYSHLVNKNFISKFIRKTNSFIVLNNGDEIPVSRRRKNSVAEQIK